MPRRLQLAIAGAATLIGIGLPPVASASADPTVASLAMGDSAFWNGAFVTDARVPDPSACGVSGPCFNYGVNVQSPGAAVLRAALETSDDSNGWQLRLLDPSGHEAASGTTYTEYGIAENYDVEVFAHNPAPGRWTVQAIPQNVHNGDFRARVALQSAAPPATSAEAARRAPTACGQGATAASHKRKHRHHKHSSHKKAKRRHHKKPKRRTAATPSAAGCVTDVPPDLSADPPWHLTFEQPPPMVVVEGGNYTALAGIHDPTMQVAGQPIYDCLPEEKLEDGAQHCLRFTTGFASLGPGPFEVYGSSDSAVAPNGGPLNQVVFRSDGSSYSRPAGEFAFHPIHAHYHVLGIARFDFFRVDGPNQLVPAAQVTKEGFCLGNIKIFDWEAFTQSEIDPKSIDNCEPSPQPDGSWRFYEGITNGWEDSYKWQTSGQYVDFGDNPNGLYLLRLTVNPARHIEESNYNNDVAYTYMQITGNDVHVIERGRGESPWDPGKTVLDPVITH
jgi:Lysyl oxidase